jgi:hypothetical protein
VVSRIRRGQGRLGRWLGLHPLGTDGTDDSVPTQLVGPAMKESPTRSGVYEIFDRTRTVAKGRAPNVGPATIAPQPIGQVSYTIARFHEKMPLYFEEISQLRVVGQYTQLDAGGQDYLSRQMAYLGARFFGAMELMLMGVIRGTWYLKNVGDDWIPVLSQPSAGTPYVTINHQIPTGNTAQLNMLGAGSIIGTSWADPTAPIVSNDLPKIMEAYAQLTGMVLTDAWTTPSVWGQIITNTEVINAGGSSQRPFDEFELVRNPGDRYAYPEWVAVLRAYPTIRWHLLAEYLVADGGTDPSYAAGTGTLTSVIPANQVLFTPEPDPEWIDVLWYGEHISEQDGQPAMKRPAWYFWNQWLTQPTVIELIGLMNAIPRLRIPKAMVPATVIFP